MNKPLLLSAFLKLSMFASAIFFLMGQSPDNVHTLAAFETKTAVRAQSAGLLIAPLRAQTAEVQQRDERECEASARKQAGLDTATQQAAAALQQSTDAFRQAMRTCLESRSYSVKDSWRQE
jgi:hypothetical protein